MSSGSSKGLRYEVLDVFAEAAFAGNPLCVVYGAGGLSTEAMQALARETNLSETTFVLRDEPRDGAFDVRIFTPAAELPYAGHPTLGTAFALRAANGGEAKRIVLRLGVGLVPVRFERDGLAWLDAPRARFEPLEPREPVTRALGLSPEALDRTLPIEVQTAAVRQLFVPLRDLAALRRCRIDATAYERLLAAGAPASLYAFARGARDPSNHWSVRLFAPAKGVPEDPATGSAAGWLGAYLLRHRVNGSAPVDVRLEQGHEIGRPSLLHVRALWDAGEPASSVGGRVVPVARGEWLQ